MYTNQLTNHENNGNKCIDLSSFLLTEPLHLILPSHTRDRSTKYISMQHMQVIIGYHKSNIINRSLQNSECVGVNFKTEIQI